MSCSFNSTTGNVKFCPLRKKLARNENCTIKWENFERQVMRKYKNEIGIHVSITLSNKLKIYTQYLSNSLVITYK